MKLTIILQQSEKYQLKMFFIRENVTKVWIFNIINFKTQDVILNQFYENENNQNESHSKMLVLP